MGEQASAQRRLPPADLQRPITPRRPQNNSQDVENHLATAWESATRAFALTCQQVKRRAVVPFLHWALSALGQPAEPAPTALPSAVPPPGALQETRRRAAEQAEKSEELQLRYRELGRSFAEEKKNHEKVRVRCQQLEASLEEAKTLQEKLRSRCRELEISLAEEEAKRRKQTEIDARTKRALDESISQMKKYLETSHS